MHPSLDNVAVLLSALSDEFHWVTYGAARSLMEIAARSSGDIRDRALGGLREFIEAYAPDVVWMRRHVLREIIETAFTDDAAPQWVDAVRPLLKSVISKEDDRGERDKLAARVSEFADRYSG
jgi:hypothetical protein